MDGYDGPRVSLWAAHLPGTEVHPFVTSSSDLPALGDGAWPRIVGSGVQGRAGDSAVGAPGRVGDFADAAAATAPPPSTAALLFCPPHFVDAEALAQRLAAVLPRGSPVLGAVGAHGAWGLPEAGVPAWGAAFLDDKIFVRDRAVGAVLHGQFEARAVPLMLWSVVCKQSITPWSV
eukprot:362529-Chlamydomonas_euryale.AAC.9